MSVPPDDAVRKLAGIDIGRTASITVTGQLITSLTYTDDKGNWATYINPNDPTDPNKKPYYVYSEGGEQWAVGQTFSIGDQMTSNGFIFRCIRAHTTGTTSRTRDPSLRSNKSSWEVVGYTTDPPREYSSTVRYAVGSKVKYKGKYYLRTDFNLVGGQVPYEDQNSDYWLLVGDAD